MDLVIGVSYSKCGRARDRARHHDAESEVNLKLNGVKPEEYHELLPPNVILLGYRGSIAHNMYLGNDRPDSVDDKDIMGVCIAPKEVYFGLDVFEQKEKMLREWDCVTYELRKYVKLLVNSNPNVLSLLWLRPNHYIYVDAWGRKLINHRNLFVSKKIFHSFTGYAYAQLKGMEKKKFDGYMGEKRKALVEKFGYDTKNAAHCIRLLRMGIEFLREGELHVFREDAPQLIDIKTGKWTMEQVKDEATRLFARAETAYDECKLPREPNRVLVNALLIDMLSTYTVYGDDIHDARNKIETLREELDESITKPA